MPRFMQIDINLYSEVEFVRAQRLPFRKRSLSPWMSYVSRTRGFLIVILTDGTQVRSVRGGRR